MLNNTYANLDEVSVTSSNSDKNNKMLSFIAFKAFYTSSHSKFQLVSFHNDILDYGLVLEDEDAHEDNL